MNLSTAMTTHANVGDMDPHRWVDYTSNLVYILLGTLIVTCNSLICLAVGRHPALRAKKEYVMVAALALADVIDGMGFVLAGGYRAMLLMKQEDDVLVSAWDCLHKPHSILFLYGQQISAQMLLCVNADRLIAMMMPVVYYRLTTCYSVCLIVPFYALSMAIALVGGAISYGSERVNKYKQICHLGYAFDRHVLYSAVFQKVRLLSGIISVVLILIVLLLLRYKRQPNVNTCVPSKKIVKFTLAQRRMHKTIALSSLFTFLLFVIPSLVKLWLEVAMPSNGYTYTVGIPITASLSNLNAIINFFIYTSRHSDIRYGILYLVTGRVLDEPELVMIMNKRRSMSALRHEIERMDHKLSRLKLIT